MTKVIHKKLGRQRAYGMVDEKNPRAVIYVDPRQRPKTYLGTCIHERVHLMFPDWSEAKVLRVERDLREFLWGLGFRQVKQ